LFIILGILVVIGAVIGGFLMEHGHLLVLMQPSELVIIGGAAVGTLLIANPIHVLKEIASGLIGAIKPSAINKQLYLDNLTMMYELLTKARKDGIAAIEADIEEPSESRIFSSRPKFLNDHHLRDFVCDTMRMTLTGGTDPFDIDQMMEVDMDVHHNEMTKPISALSNMAESLPGLGIVAAVLGVVITMGSLSGPPEEVGNKVAAALVGTFLGILLCYGFVGPIAANMTKTAEDEHAILHVLRLVMISSMKGSAPIMAVEMGRRAVPARVRPSFQDLEAACRAHTKAAAAAEA
jgi:chemotaxis protein MotA